MNKKISKEDFILSWKAMISFVLVLLVICMIEVVVYGTIADSTTVYKGQCVVETWRVPGKFFHQDMAMILSYDGGKKATCLDPVVLTSYLLNPGPLDCKIKKNDIAYCERRPLLAEK